MFKTMTLDLLYLWYRVLQVDLSIVLVSTQASTLGTVFVMGVLSAESHGSRYGGSYEKDLGMQHFSPCLRS